MGPIFGPWVLNRRSVPDCTNCTYSCLCRYRWLYARYRSNTSPGPGGCLAWISDRPVVFNGDAAQEAYSGCFDKGRVAFSRCDLRPLVSTVFAQGRPTGPVALSRGKGPCRRFPLRFNGPDRRLRTACTPASAETGETVPPGSAPHVEPCAYTPRATSQWLATGNASVNRRCHTIVGMNSGRPRSAPTRAASRRGAKRRFGQPGYDRITSRGIATAASIDLSMVVRYSGNKESCSSTPRIRPAPAPTRPTSVPSVRYSAGEPFVERWDGDETRGATALWCHGRNGR